jgi:NADH-quinone oxidoreductase subunit D
MAKELFDGIYSSHKLVFIERVEKNLEFYLKNKLIYTKRLGQEILCAVSKENLYSVLEELKKNNEFDVQILNSINKYSIGKDWYLLINLSSVVNNFSLLLKITLLNKNGESLNCEYNEIIDIVKNFFDSAAFYKDRSDLKLNNSDIVIGSQFLDGLDSFDLYLSTNNDIIEQAYFDTSISKIIDNDFYNNSEIMNLLTYISRFDYTAGIFPELCLCMGIEELMQLRVLKRVQYIRMLLCELFRISSHIYFISNISKILGCDLVYNLSLIERERVLKIIEFITGSRINTNFIRIGGVRKDINDEKIKSIKDNLPVFFRKISKIETMLLDDSVVTARLKNVGVADKRTALEYGVSGPNLRAAGVRYDLRKNRNLLLYKDISFLIALGKFGDCLDRVQIRFGEIYQSLKIIEQILDDLPEEHVKKLLNLEDLEFPLSSMISSIECPHGVFKIYIEVKENKILNFLVIGPSKNSIYFSEKMLPGSKLEDLELILASLDISSGEIMQAI